jgi:ankyrin repeat protein
MAAKTGNQSVAAWLLEHGADVHENETEVEAPLLEGDAHPSIVKLLLDHGASEPPLAVASIAGAPNAVARLLAKHVPVNPKDGSTPLYDAVTSTVSTPKNKRLVIEKLLLAGADPNVGEESQTPMSVLPAQCGEEHEQDVQDKQDKQEKVQEKGPLPCLALIQLLGSRGARVSGDTLQSALALDEPVRGRVLDALLVHRLEPDATSIAIAQINVELQADAARKIAARGVAWAWHDGEADASAPLLDAIERFDAPLVKLMLDLGAPADMHFKDGRSPLGLALDRVADSNEVAARIVDLLVSHGANVNRRLPDGRTPLFAAAESGDIRVVNTLLEHGARVNEVILDESALDAAERSGHIPVARILHARGGRRLVKPAQ